MLNVAVRKPPRAGGQELLFCLASSVIVFFAVAIEKALRRKGWIHNQSAR